MKSVVVSSKASNPQENGQNFKIWPSNSQERYIDLKKFGPQIRKIADTKHQELPGALYIFSGFNWTEDIFIIGWEPYNSNPSLGTGLKVVRRSIFIGVESLERGT